MARQPLFIDDENVAAALDRAATAAIAALAPLLPAVADAPYRERLRTALAALVSAEGIPGLAPLVHGADAFGDRFALEDLPLPRPGHGYAVQMLDTDTLLDRSSGKFLAVRDPALKALFASFDEAHGAARDWLREQGAGTDRYPLAIVPVSHDELLQRHVLIYGVLKRQP